MNISLYAHGGSENHGCEALVRSTIKVLDKYGKNNYKLLSESPAQDIKYGINEIADVLNAKDKLPTGLKSLFYRINMSISKDETVYYNEIYRRFVKKVGSADWALAIGGDNYCYKGFPEQYGFLNGKLHKNNIRTALWGCSIDPFRINNKMLADLNIYDFITARESITYNALKDNGLDNIYLVPDTAFVLDKVENSLPKGFVEKNTVGINVSPLIINYEKNDGITLVNYENLIKYIISDTNMQIALIPHVVWEKNNDLVPLKYLYDKFKDTGRVVLIGDCKASELKGYISRCRFLVAARTHASIAGYSESVPTLVVGYSVKAKGIAMDLFGTDDNYVVSVNSLSDDNALTEKFHWLMMHEDKILNHYDVMLPNYVAGLNKIDKILK